MKTYRRKDYPFYERAARATSDYLVERSDMNSEGTDAVSPRCACAGVGLAEKKRDGC